MREAIRGKVPLEKWDVCQTPGRMKLLDQFQELERYCGRKWQVVRIPPITADFSYSKYLKRN